MSEVEESDSKIDYKARLFNVLEMQMQFGLQLQVSANNLKAELQQKEKDQLEKEKGR